MASLNVNATNSSQCPRLPSSYWEPNWYAAYTSANHEKRVAEQFAQKSVEHFLPLYESVRRWKDRRVQLQMPLFPGYIFARLSLQDRLQVLQVSGVANLVGFNGTPAVLPEEEIEALKKLVASGIRAEPSRYTTVGKRIRICVGPLAGREGILVRRKGSLRIVLSIDLVQRAILVDVDASALEPL
jgi:transcription antitermination factor NusG